MSQLRWRSTGLSIALATGCMLFLIAPPVADLSRQPHPAVGPFQSLVPARLKAQLGRGRLELQVTSLSAQHEAELAAVLDKRFAGQQVNTDFRRGIVAPEQWLFATQQALVTFATLDSGRIVLQGNSLELTGFTRNRAAFEREQRALIALLPPDVQVASDIAVAADIADADALCDVAFGAFADVQIPFERSSAELRTSAHAVLDKLVEFAFDCRDSTIVITGHTDAVGDDARNQELSLLRARAIVTYLARAGIDPARLEAYGAGSAEPIADNDTAYGRSRNRRIEFTLR